MILIDWSYIIAVIISGLAIAGKFGLQKYIENLLLKNHKIASIFGKIITLQLKLLEIQAIIDKALADNKLTKEELILIRKEINSFLQISESLKNELAELFKFDFKLMKNYINFGGGG